MRIILSPTKQMKREEELHFSLSEPVFIEKTKILREYLKGLPYEDLKALLNCNDKIALENYERFQEMDFNQRLTPALLSYDGIAFKYMAPQVFSQDLQGFTQGAADARHQLRRRTGLQEADGALALAGQGGDRCAQADQDMGAETGGAALEFTLQTDQPAADDRKQHAESDRKCGEFPKSVQK